MHQLIFSLLTLKNDVIFETAELHGSFRPEEITSHYVSQSAMRRDRRGV